MRDDNWHEQRRRRKQLIYLLFLADFRRIRDKYGWSAFPECIRPSPLQVSRHPPAETACSREGPTNEKTAEHVVFDGIVASRGGE